MQFFIDNLNLMIINNLKVADKETPLCKLQNYSCISDVYGKQRVGNRMYII